ncbi:oxidoreductase [bacterium SCGC AG-212-C10]|nr:oxidoreductase [bacterium SCGC AG-212-C10]
MKFHWFAEVTYPHLAPDFPKKHKSAWVDPPVSLMDPKKVGETYKMFIRLMEHADRMGFDGLAVNEHHQTAFAMTPSPNLLAASLASNTQNAAILVIGDSLALYNPPTRVAEEMAYLDCLSGGRLIAGFVFGTPMDSTFSYGTPPVELRERFHEARELIVRSWQEPEPFAFNGKYTKLRYVNPWPRPVQSPPPIWVPGSGSVETWDLVIDEDYCYGHLSFSGLQSAKPLVDGFWEYVDKRGGNTNPNRMAFTQICCVSETDEQAEADYYEAVKYFYTHNPVAAGFAAPPGYRTVESIKAEMERGAGGISAENRMKAAKGEMSFWEYDEKGYIIAGSPARVRERIRELAKSIRVGQLIPTLHMGNLSEETAMKNTTLFGEQVIPYLRDLWEDQEDRWTPQVSQQRVAAAARRVEPVGVGGAGAGGAA